jgi:hypothetical protein
MKEKLKAFAKWCEKEWLALVIGLILAMMIFLVLVLVSWLFGYWSNGLRGTHFEINSCLTGIGAVCTGMLSVVGLAKAAWMKYGYDSKYNTPIGAPVIKKEENNDKGTTSNGNSKGIDSNGGRRWF